MPTRIRFAGLLTLSALWGCFSTQLAQFPLVSTRNLARSPRVVAPSVTGRDCVRLILGLIPTGGPIQIEKALAAALQESGASLLLNAQLQFRTQLTGLSSQSCAEASGDAGVLQ